MKNRKYILFLITAFLLLPRPAFPHANSVSYSNITIEEMALTYNLMTYVMDLWQMVWIDDDNDGVVSETELTNHRAEILEYITEKIMVAEGDHAYQPEVIRYETVTDTSWGTFQVVGLDIDFQFNKGQPWSEDLTLACTLYNEIDYLHQSFAVITCREKRREFVFFNDNVFETAELFKGPWADAVYYWILGMEGLSEKTECLVFLCGILIAAARWINILRNILAFALAMTLTLWLAATGRMLLDARFVEAAVGLTVAYIGIENFFSRDDDWRWLVTGFFGLIYGFSLSLPLRYVGVDADQLPVALFMYGVGIWSLLAAVTAAGGVLYSLLRRFFWYPWVILRGQSAVLILLGGIWCYERFAGTSLWNLQGVMRVVVTLLVVEALFIMAPLRWYRAAKLPAGTSARSPESQAMK